MALFMRISLSITLLFRIDWIDSMHQMNVSYDSPDPVLELLVVSAASIISPAWRLSSGAVADMRPLPCTTETR